MKNKIVLIVSLVIVMFLAIMIFLLYTGRARTDVYIKDFEISKDGNKMIVEVGVTSSAGYVRKMKRTGGSTNGYYTFYSTYGINSKIGAKDTFEIKLDDNMDEIYVYTGNKGYRLELVRKNPDSEEWVRINYTENGTFKLKLTDRDEIVKVGINTMAQDNNYFEYTDKDTIEKIYNIFGNLETNVVSKTANPIDSEKTYAVVFLDDSSENAIVDTYLEVYKKEGRYFAEQSYNGIYEITEEDFNLIKSYTK